jgi:hypothetical protein
MPVRTVFAVLLALVIAAPAFAQEQTADQFLHGIYDQYKGDAAPPLDQAAMARTFTPELAKLIKADSEAAAAKGEVPKLAGDPFIDAQDWKIDQVKVATEESATLAVGTVTFQNFGEPFEIKLDLVKLPEGWRIAEIYSPSGKLTALFSK